MSKLKVSHAPDFETKQLPLGQEHLTNMCLSVQWRKVTGKASHASANTGIKAEAPALGFSAAPCAIPKQKPPNEHWHGALGIAKPKLGLSPLVSPQLEPGVNQDLHMQSPGFCNHDRHGQKITLLRVILTMACQDVFGHNTLYILTINLAFILTSIWHCIWNMFWNSI